MCHLHIENVIFTACIIYKQIVFNFLLHKFIGCFFFLTFLTVDDINDKLKHVRSYYARELAKVTKSKKSGAGTAEVYKSKLAYFDTLDAFLRPQITPRKSVTNLVSLVFISTSSKQVPLPIYLAIGVEIVFKFIPY